MPEGPEIRRAADCIEKQIGGRVIDNTWFAFPELASQPIINLYRYLGLYFQLLA